MEIQNKYNRLLEEYKRLQQEIERAKEEIKKAEQKRQEILDQHNFFNVMFLGKQQMIQKLKEEEKKLIERINMIIQEIKKNKYYDVFKETEEYKNITKLINKNDDEEENNNYRNYGPRL